MKQIFILYTFFILMVSGMEAFPEYIDHRLYQYKNDVIQFEEAEAYVVVSGDAENRAVKPHLPSPPENTQSESKTITIYFRINSAHIGSSEQEKLNSLINSKADTLFRATGYTCPLGPLDFNHKLARARVEAVDRFLKSKHLQLSQKEVKTNCCYVSLDKQHLWKNRRVEVEVMQKNKY